MSELININVVIAERTYPLKIRPEEEEDIRAAAREINDQVKGFQAQYQARDKQDYLAMVALKTVVENREHRRKITIEDEAFLDKLEKLDERLSAVIEA